MKDLKNIKIGDLIYFKTKYENLNADYCVGFIHSMNEKSFSVGPYSERITLCFIPQFEHLIHYKNIKSWKKLDCTLDKVYEEQAQNE